MSGPMLDPPSEGWSRDLPLPTDTPLPLAAVGDPPNHVDEVYLEVSRSTLQGRGGLLWLGMASIAFSIYFLWLQTGMGWGAWFNWVLASVMLGFGVHCVRLDVALPRDEPIRFNHLRRKIYVYGFQQASGPLHRRKPSRITAQEFDWDDVRAEFCRIYVPGMAYNSRVNLAVVKPGTNKVMERFLFGHGIVAEIRWNMVIAFMQQGPAALPKFDHPPRDWNNEDPELNLARRLAPKVKWPDAMDLESRTAP